jgi:crossover junction endodeoxyribonuclease RuvC
MKILGIDPGTAKIGCGFIRKTKKGLSLIDYLTIETDKKTPPILRLKQIHSKIKKLLKKTEPNLVVIENLYFFKNAKTAISVSQAKGVILLAVAQKKLPLLELTPLQVKMGICGYGKASKRQIQLMIKKILGMETIPKSDDAADALALAICGARYFLKIKKNIDKVF